MLVFSFESFGSAKSYTGKALFTPYPTLFLDFATYKSKKFFNFFKILAFRLLIA